MGRKAKADMGIKRRKSKMIEAAILSEKFTISDILILDIMINSNVKNRRGSNIANIFKITFSHFIFNSKIINDKNIVRSIINAFIVIIRLPLAENKDFK